MSLKSNLKNIWNFIWHDDSMASWFVNIILAFILIKFVIYPVLGLLLQTAFPIVAVVSGSMEHDVTKEYSLTLQGEKIQTGRYRICDKIHQESDNLNYNEYWQNCGDWYEKINISKDQFKDFRFHNGFNTGDIMILHSKKNVKVGDTIVFFANRPEPIIHRVVEVNEDMYRTKGDHNDRADGWVNDEQVIGKALFRIPLLGYVKIVANEFVNIFR